MSQTGAYARAGKIVRLRDDHARRTGGRDEDHRPGRHHRPFRGSIPRAGLADDRLSGVVVARVLTASSPICPPIAPPTSVELRTG